MGHRSDKIIIKIHEKLKHKQNRKQKKQAKDNRLIRVRQSYKSRIKLRQEDEGKDNE